MEVSYPYTLHLLCALHLHAPMLFQIVVFCVSRSCALSFLLSVKFVWYERVRACVRLSEWVFAWSAFDNTLLLHPIQFSTILCAPHNSIMLYTGTHTHNYGAFSYRSHNFKWIKILNSIFRRRNSDRVREIWTHHIALMNERENYKLIAGVCQHQTGSGVLCNGNRAPYQRKLLTYANFTRPYHIQLLFFLMRCTLGVIVSCYGACTVCIHFDGSTRRLFASNPQKK